MPKITVDVATGSRTRVRTGRGVSRTVAYEVATAPEETCEERSARRFGGPNGRADSLTGPA